MDKVQDLVQDLDQNLVQDLKAPTLLLAMPQVRDPFFSRSIVLLAVHEDEGSFGFVVNRPTELSVGEILGDLKIGWNGDPEAPAFLGGPVQPQVGTILFPSATPLAHRSDSNCYTELAPGISITQNLESLAKLADTPPQGLRLLLGHAGWSAGQLIKEVSRHDWLMAPAEARLVFADDPQAAWGAALDSVGIDAASLPNWIGDRDQAN